MMQLKFLDNVDSFLELLELKSLKVQNYSTRLNYKIEIRNIFVTYETLWSQGSFGTLDHFKQSKILQREA